MKLVIGLVHAGFAEERRENFEKVRSQLVREIEGYRDLDLNRCVFPLIVHTDFDAKGSLTPWIRAVQSCLTIHDDATHLCLIPDDAILCNEFVRQLLACIEAKPNDILCFQSNHPKCVDVASSWYCTPDGFTGFGGTMPVDDWKAYLAWREATILPDTLVQFDEGVNLWAMANGFRILKSLPSLMDHATYHKSLDGNVDGPLSLSPRESLVFREDIGEVDWNLPPVDLGRTYVGNHWNLILKTKPDQWEKRDLIERAYAVARGRSVEKYDGSNPKLMLATPAYGHVDARFLVSREHAMHDLRTRGIDFDVVTSEGHSLVTRARHVLMHLFLMSDCTHFFQWDSDVECMNPRAIVGMLATGHDVIGGAYPLRQKKLATCAELTPETKATGKLPIVSDCAEVAAVGTGFLLVSRAAILRLCHAHPELVYTTSFEGSDGSPFFALFDTKLEGREYHSEDWQFCRLWRALGEKVYAYVKPRFRHWGRSAFEGSALEAWGATD